MKINISRQHIYLLLLSVIFFIAVLIFSFSFFIPEGKEFRRGQAELKLEKLEFRRDEAFHNETFEVLKELQGKNRAIITSLKTNFDPKRFQKQYAKHFIALKLSDKMPLESELAKFDVYEVNATSRIDSPTSFYSFLEAINKGDTLVSVEFPIKFKKDKENIWSSFSIKVYRNTQTKTEEVK